MEKLKRRYEKLLAVYQACQRAITLYGNPRKDACEGELEAYTASVVKHYELLYEVLWKFLKHYLRAKFLIEVKGSRDAFRICFDYDLINDVELKILLGLVQKRNTTAHVYDEESATHICQDIIQDFSVIEAFIARLKGQV